MIADADNADAVLSDTQQTYPDAQNILRRSGIILATTDGMSSKRAGWVDCPKPAPASNHHDSIPLRLALSITCFAVQLIFIVSVLFAS